MPDPSHRPRAPLAAPDPGGSEFDSVWRRLEGRGSRSFLVMSGAQLVVERYADGWSADRRHATASLAKPLVAGLALGLAMNDGLIHPDEAACRYVEEWQEHPLKSKITIRQLATHSSGLADADVGGQDTPGWRSAFWHGTECPMALARDVAPVLFEPGSGFSYSNPGIGMLSYCVTVALKESAWPDVTTFLDRRLREPLGLGDRDWTLGNGNTYSTNGLSLIDCWAGGSITARALARLGQLLLQEGTWEGQQILDASAVHALVSHAETPLPTTARRAGNPSPGCGLVWWTNFDGVWPCLPVDAFAGAGAGHQVLLVIPSWDLVVVRQGSALDPELERDDFGRRFWSAVVEHLFEPLAKCFRQRAD